MCATRPKPRCWRGCCPATPTQARGSCAPPASLTRTRTPERACQAGYDLTLCLQCLPGRTNVLTDHGVRVRFALVKAAEPPELTADRIRLLLFESWQREAEVAYAPVGHGSYHWIGYERTKPTWFITGDRVAGNRLKGLEASARLARELADGDLTFVVAPLADKAGNLINVVDDAWALQVLPYVTGSSSDQGEWNDSSWTDPLEQGRIAHMIGQLHAYPAPEFVPQWDPTPPYWEQLNNALRLVRVANGGQSQRTGRAHAKAHAQRDLMLALIDRYQLLVAEVLGNQRSWVLTHGEPDSDNVIRTEDGHMLLIDWTTAAVAPRERDLFDVMQGPEDITAPYEQGAGAQVINARALEMIGLHWRLSHLGHDLDLLLSPDKASPYKLHRAWQRFTERLVTPPGKFSVH